MDTKEAGLFNVVICGAILLAGVILYFVLTMVKQLRQNQKAMTTRHLAEIAVIEWEKERMSRDLHDDLGPYVSTIAGYLSRLNPQTVEEEKQLQTCLDVVDKVVQKIHHFSMSMLPTHLKELGLLPAVQAFIEHLNNKHLDIRLEHDRAPQLTEAQSLQVFRILQEIIHNSIKHASPGELRIVLENTDEDFIIRTADSGGPRKAPGYKPRGSGMGIRNIRSRVLQLGGEVHINIDPKRGSRYVIRIPITAN